MPAHPHLWPYPLGPLYGIREEADALPGSSDGGAHDPYLRISASPPSRPNSWPQKKVDDLHKDRAWTSQSAGVSRNAADGDHDVAGFDKRGSDSFRLTSHARDCLIGKWSL